MPVFVLADTVNLQFSPDSQMAIGPNQSAKIIVKVSSPATETIYFLPTSTSITGQFTPFSTGKAGSYYISRGDSTKSFYYKDSTEGNFTIKISPNSAKGSSFISIEQGITVSFSASNNQSTDSGDSGQNSGSSNSDSNPSDDSSVHTGETSLSDYKKEALKIGAGRERLATVRTPIMFSASQNKKGKQTNYFTWSFGDGTSAIGAEVYHTYQFPGRYDVVLNGLIDGEEEAVARTTVLVTESNIKITAVDLSAGYVEITNNSDREQNLNNWGLRSGEKTYVFPLDTIISPQSSIKIPLKAVGLINQDVEEIILAYPDGGVASGASLQSGLNSPKLADLKKQLVKIKQQLAEKISEVPETRSQVPQDLVLGTTTPKNVVVLAKEPSWFEKIKNAIFK